MIPKFGESAKQPIDVDALDDSVKVEEDIYGQTVKEEGGEATPAPWTPSPSKSPKKPKNPNRQNTPLPYRRPTIHRRHPEDADTEDKVLMTLIDGGMTWQYEIFNNEEELICREASAHFPGVPMKVLKTRYADKKAKTRKWTPHEVS